MIRVPLAAIINLTVFSCLLGQSKTLEIAPDFHKTNTDYVTSEIQFETSKEDTEFLGLSCYQFDRAEVAIFYRLKTMDQWSQWVIFEKQHEFVEPNRSAYRTKPIKTSFSAIQFKTNKKLKSALTIRFFLAAFKDNGVIHKPVRKSIKCELPELCQRMCWCPTCPIDDTPEFTEPTHLIVHHSAGNNQSDDFATVVEYIWDLHVNTNGWDDIGYNWLIDPEGILYEGRGDNFQGAHFSCINENTVGICVIGDYSLVEPAEAALTTLVSVLAYEATEHTIDITDQSYHVTGDFILDNLAGHRDSSGSSNACSATVCPGDSFYPFLEVLRVQVSELPCYQNVNSIADSNIQDLNFYPNPFHDYLFVSSTTPLKLELYDLQGRCTAYAYSEKGNDLSHLEAGVYFLVCEGKMVDRIVKR